MDPFATVQLQGVPTELAPDGSEARRLQRLAGGSMTHFTLAPGQVSGAVMHRTVEEIWFVLSGHGEMWRRQGAREDVAALTAGVCLAVPLGAQFQFRAFGPDPITVLIVTMPPWPGDSEAVPVTGPWTPTLG